MIGKNKLFVSSASLFLLTASILSMPVCAEWDVEGSYHFTGDSKDDVQAFSDFDKIRWEFTTNIHDTVTVLATAPDTIKSLKVDWKIGDGHRLSGTLPQGGDWELKNDWYTYKFAPHKDYTLELTPTVSPPVAAFTKTAEGHYPWLPTDIFTKIIDKIVSKPIEVGGMLATTSNREQRVPQQGDTTYSPEEIEAYWESEAGNNQKGDTHKILHVYAAVKKSGDEFGYQYWAENFTDEAIDGNWTFYDGESGEAIGELSFNIGAKVKKLLQEISSAKKPLEQGGQVAIQINGRAFTFFAPVFLMSEETAESGTSAQTEDTSSGADTGQYETAGDSGTAPAQDGSYRGGDDSPGEMDSYPGENTLPAEDEPYTSEDDYPVEMDEYPEEDYEDEML